MHPPDEEQLISQCLAGDRAAYGQLVVRYQDRLFHSLTLLLPSHEDARDIAQEAFVQAYQKLDTFRGDAAFYSWLYRIAHNLGISHLRKRPRPTTSLEALREDTGAEPLEHNPDAQPLGQLLRAEDQQLVRETLAKLPDEYRTVLVLKEFEGLPYEEIAALIACPIGTVRSRIHRGRRELAERLRRELQSGTDG